MHSPTFMLQRAPAWALACAAILFLPPSLEAQADSSSLATVLAEADRSSPRIAAARASARAAVARVGTNTRPPDPQVQLGWMNYAVPDLAAMPPLTMRQVQVMQMLPVAGRLRAQRASSEAAAAAASIDETTVRAMVRRDVASAYFRTHRLDGEIALARTATQLAQDLRALSAAMHRAGEGQQAEVLRADVEVARMQADVEAMQAMRAAAAAELTALLNQPADAARRPTVPTRYPDHVPSLDTLLARALLARPEIARTRAEVTRSEAMERVAKSELWPDITLGVQLATGQVAAGMRESMGSVMIGAGVPVFARRRQLQMREEAAAMRTMAEADVAMMAAETRAEVAMAHAALLRARSLRTRYVDEVLPSAEAARVAALAAFRAGTLPFMSALDAQMALVRFRSELLQLEEDEGLAWAALEALTATPWLTMPGVASSGDNHE